MMMTLNKKDVKEISVSHIKCDGTVNACIYMKDGSELELFGLSIGQSRSLEKMRWSEILIGEQLLSQSEAQWLRQNGIAG
jgi:hypothetical protein